MKTEHILAKRTHKVIYQVGDHAIKVFDQKYPKTDVLNEALNQARVEETGLPIPKIHAVTTAENGEWSITLDYIEGKTLAQIMEENPDQLEKYMEQFVDLQLEIHAKRAPLLNKLKDKMDRKINDLGQKLNPSVRYELKSRLGGMPKHNKVLHGDYTPSNIVIDKNGKAFILDWAHATQGNASADAANTYLLLTLRNPKIAELYLNMFCEKSDTAKQYVLLWLPIMAAARLLKEIPEESELLLKWLDVKEYE